MAIRWNEFPHQRIRLDIYARLARNDVARSNEDSLRRILLRRLPSLNAEDHRRYIELEARSLVEHLRVTRDVYRESVESQGCRPVLEAQWVVLRFAVFPTAISILRRKVTDYAKLTKVPGRDLSLLFGVLTRTCYEKPSRGIASLRAPNLEDETAATDKELESLGKLVDEHRLLIFKDIRDEGGAVVRLCGGGPFSVDDPRAILNSFRLGAVGAGITVPEWRKIRERLWYLRVPWTEGLCDLFNSVQEELMSQWRVLPSDSLVHELELGVQNSRPRPVVVPSMKPAGEAEKRRRGRKPRLRQEFVVCAGMLWRNASSNNARRVSDGQLQQIATALDAAGHLPPSAHLEGKAAQELKAFNSHNSNSKTGPVMTWSRLISLGDKDLLRGMRRLLSRCAGKLDDRRLSGN
jgi:hypothetical protein